MNRANRWQALAVVAGLTVSLEAGAAPAPQKTEKAPKAAKPAPADAPKPPRAQKAAPLSGGVFGQEGQFVLSSSTSLQFGYTTAGDVGLLAISPAADYFFMDNLSLGAAIPFGVAFGEGSGFSIGLAPRVGYHLKLGESISWWPRAGLGFLVIDEANQAPNSVLGTDGFNFQVEAYAPFLFHVTPSFFVGIGPRVGMSIGEVFDAAFLLDTTVGGHF